jgi:sensitive to high expression protein 9, mitochondrial
MEYPAYNRRDESYALLGELRCLNFGSEMPQSSSVVRPPTSELPRMFRTSLRTDRARILRQFPSSRAPWSSTPSSSQSSSNTSSSTSEHKAAPKSPSSPSSQEPSPVHGYRTEDSSTNNSSANPEETSKLSLDLDSLRHNLRKWTDGAAINFRQKADDFTGSTKVTFSQLGSNLNKVTGYNEIEALKRQVVEQGA